MVYQKVVCSAARFRHARKREPVGSVYLLFILENDIYTYIHLAGI